MEENTKVNGKITVCMEKANIIGKMVEDMKEIIIWIRNKEREFTIGLMAENMMVNGIMENSMDKANMYYPMVQHDLVFGNKEKE